MQLTAVLLLVMLLFPVISLTDDLATCMAPRDAELTLRLHDPLDHAPAAALAASVFAWVDLVAANPHDGPAQPVEQQATLTGLLAGVRHAIDSRPPPCA